MERLTLKEKADVGRQIFEARNKKAVAEQEDDEDA
jgi:hypothetical protein